MITGPVSVTTPQHVDALLLQHGTTGRFWVTHQGRADPLPLEGLVVHP